MDNVDVNDNDTAIQVGVINAVQNEDAAEMKVDVDEDSDDECDSEDEDNIELTEDVMVQLKNNDPTITTVDIFFDDDDGVYFDATTIDWEKDGSAISDNTHLKAVYTNKWYHYDDETDVANAKAFCRALSKNRSIKRYYMDGCPLDVGETFSLLTPFFKHNTNLRSVTLTLHGDFDVRNSEVAMSALAECQCLRKVSLHCGVDNDVAEYLVSSLGAHLNLREVILSFHNSNGNGDGNNIGKKWIIALGDLLQNHVSKLRTLNLNSNYVGDEGASILGETLSKNRTLKKLSLDHVESTTPGWAALFRGIANSVSLEEISIKYNRLGNEEALSFATEYTIARITSIKSLNMTCQQSITSVGWSTLFRSLFNPSSILEKLDLDYNSIGDIGVTTLGDALASSNAKLKILNLGDNKSITAAGWSAFFQHMSNTNNLLEDIDLHDNNIDDEALVALTAALSTNLKLKILNLGYNRSISSEGWQTFFTTLQNFDLSFLEQLILPCNNIRDTVMPSLISALTNARSLFRLNLGGNDTITPVGWTALSNILQRPESSLADLSLAVYNPTNINDEVAIGFANALINNKSLKTLNFGGYSNNSNTVTARGWAALANVLCNKSSLESIYNSNHTVMKVVRGNINHDLESHLRMNENDNKHEVARQKILKYHFADGEENVEEFVEMELAIIPYAIAWMGRDSTGHSLLYNVVRSLPTLFDSNAKKAKAKCFEC